MATPTARTSKTELTVLLVHSQYRVDLGGAGICFAFCEGNDGDLNCGAGAQCVRPEEPILYLDVARDAADEYVPCTAASDCEAYNTADDLPYECIELTIGNFCSRALKMCVSDDEAASMSSSD